MPHRQPAFSLRRKITQLRNKLDLEGHNIVLVEEYERQLRLLEECTSHLPKP
jgi:hypothetical protein